jgi:2-polyprenyl-3-methyl-5-hydroxy-6-metoxy-1,4-benzoquinol methylase
VSERSDPRHWDAIYTDEDPAGASWCEDEPIRSLALVRDANLPKDAPILDVGGGTSKLALRLAEDGYHDITVADISAEALAAARAQTDRPEVAWVAADVRDQDFGRQYDLWHDRAVFHFMVQANDRDAYLRVLRATVRPEGHVVLATFGPNGPDSCSGLPVRRYDAQALADLLAMDFDLISAESEVHRTPSGASQEFTYAHFRCAPIGS